MKTYILKNHTIQVSEIREPDITLVTPILTAHVRDRNNHEVLLDEIAEIESYMHGNKDDYGRTRKYFVARDKTGGVWGCMAYSIPDPDMIKHFNIENPNTTAELLNAFVSPSVIKGGGIGRKLFNAICKDAKDNGNNLLIINSGPRYKDSWGFYDKMCGKNCGMIKEKFGKGGDAMTWKKEL